MRKILIALAVLAVLAAAVFFSLPPIVDGRMNAVQSAPPYRVEPRAQALVESDLDRDVELAAHLLGAHLPMTVIQVRNVGRAAFDHRQIVVLVETPRRRSQQNTHVRQSAKLRNRGRDPLASGPPIEFDGVIDQSAASPR